jgi:hypothetical protein
MEPPPCVDEVIPYSLKRCSVAPALFGPGSSTLVHSRDTALLGGAQSSVVLIAGCAGERSTRLIGGVFR